MEIELCRAKPQASFTARLTSRAVAKAELSDPTVPILALNLFQGQYLIGGRKLIG